MTEATRVDPIGRIMSSVDAAHDRLIAPLK